MNWLGIAPPFTLSTNSKPLPRGNGSTFRYTSPNWPAPPVCFLWRLLAPALTAVGSRDGIDAGGGSQSDFYCDDIFSRTVLIVTSPGPRITGSLAFELWSL